MINDKEEQLIVRRFMDLSRMAATQYRDIFTGFLGLNELTLLFQNQRKLDSVPYSLYGGLSDAERKIICFHGQSELLGEIEFHPGQSEITLSKEQYQQLYPILCIHISPVNQKFSDSLTHRDFLGAILNLGIDRSKVGDILLQENEAYVFCEDIIAPFIVEQLHKIKHTNINAKIRQAENMTIERNYIEVTGTVTSVRLDAIISVAFKSSRSSLSGLVTGGKVFVNGREVCQSSFVPKENDIISVRGMGKFIYIGTRNQTKKGRYQVTIKRYS